MKITRRQLRRIIKEAVESEYYKDLKSRTADGGKITGDSKQFAKVILDQIDSFASGIKSNFDPLDVKFRVYATINSEFNNRYKDVTKEYDKNIRNPRNTREAERASSRKKVTSDQEYRDIDPEVDDHFW